jgi:DNA-binding transcriptional MocR family regulator
MAAWLAQSALTVDPEHIVLTAGGQHGLSAAFAAVLKPGDTLLTEELTYSGARFLAQQMHVKLRGVAMDGEGLKPDALESACRASRARVLYCMPRLQNPTSAMMSERRRRQIAAIAEKHHLTIVEDDVYGFASPERTPLAAGAPDRTVFVTSLSKSLFPGMRLGCVVAPPAVVERVVGAVWSTVVMASPIGADLLSGWIEDGTAARIAEWKRHDISARQTMARSVLQGMRLQTHAASPHIWLDLPARWSSELFVAQARSRGVILNASTQFAVGETHPCAVRVCLGPPRTRAGLEQALTIVRDTLLTPPIAVRAV